MRNLIAGLTLLGLAGPGMGAVLLSTDFNTLTSDSVPVNGTNRSVGAVATFTGVDLTKVNVASVQTFTVGTNVYGSAADPISAGKWITMLGDGSYDSGSVNASIRFTGTSDPARANVQINSSTVGRANQSFPINTGLFSFVFEVAAGETLSGLSTSFSWGTAQTSGAWDSLIASTTFGTATATIFDLNGASVLTLGTATSPVGPVSGPAIANIVAPSVATLAAGTYRFEIAIANGSTNQRPTIDNFSFSGDFDTGVIPEPASIGLLAGVGGLLLRRRT